MLFTSESGISFFISIGLFDGDSKLDFVSHSSSSDKSVRGVYLYLTRNGFNPRTSSFDRENASKVFLDSTIFWTSSFAHLNDSLRRVDMLGAFRRLQDADRAIALSGQGNGMNSQFDAFYSTQESGLSSGFAFNTIQPLIDCTGDGWEDLIVGHQNWPDNSAGIAMILAGGPYIPLDDPTVGVRTEPMANHERGLYLWPNPATTELNIAWRGDLAAMPARFAVHDITGTMITENEVRPGLGTARWSTAGVASGTYLLTAYDRSGNIIASVQIAVAH